MSSPLIDQNWRDPQRGMLRSRKFLVGGLAMLLIVTAGVLTCFKTCTKMGRAGSDDTYQYVSEIDGFVGKTNRLLAALIAECDTTVDAVDLESMRRRYPGLEFALPYNEDHKPVIEAADLRLVAIHPEHIRDRQLRDYYYNSRLPQLLQQQAEHMGDNYFRISTKAEDARSVEGQRLTVKPLVLKAITVNRSMFKVALAKNPWKGTITANRDCLFEEGRTAFLSYGGSMLPLPVNEGVNTRSVTYHIDTRNAVFRRDGHEVDLYAHYQAMCNPGNPDRCGILRINLGERDGHQTFFSIACQGDSVRLNTTRVRLRIYDGQTHEVSVAGEQQQAGNLSVRRSDGMKIMAYNAEGNSKLAEFTLTDHNPLHTLSRLVHSQTGMNRYETPAGMTDLFTQQMVRGLSRHLSNRSAAGIDEVAVSLDPIFSRLLEDKITDYLHHSIVGHHSRAAGQTEDAYDISVTVMDMATGEILATPFYTSRFDARDLPDELRLTTRNVALSRRYLGSTFKPILALAAVEADPALLDLHMRAGIDHYVTTQPVDWNGSLKSRFLGYEVDTWAKGADSRGQWKAGCYFSNFLGHSDDIYPVALAAYAMSGHPYTAGQGLNASGTNNYFAARTRKNGTRRLVMRRDANGLDLNPATFPFMHWLTHITGCNLRSEVGADSTLFRHLEARFGSKRKDGQKLSAEELYEERHFGVDEVSPDVTNLHEEVLSEDPSDNVRGTLVPWVLGQGSNEWTAVQIVTAWARILTGHAVSPSFIHAPQAEAVSSLFSDEGMPGCNRREGFAPRTAAQARDTWGRYIDTLSVAQGTGIPGSTVRHMTLAVRRLNASLGRQGDDVLVAFSKTGTPDAYDRYDIPLVGSNRRFLDIGLFTFGLMTQREVQRAKAGHMPKGIVCNVRITRTYRCAGCEEAQRRGKAQCAACLSTSGLGSKHARDLFTSDDAWMRRFYEMTKRYY